MELFHGKTNIDFIGKRWLPISVSAIVTFGGLAILAVKGLNYSMEFTGGTLLQVSFAQPVDMKDMRAALDGAGLHPEIQSVQNQARPSYILREKGGEQAVEAASDKTLGVLKAAFPSNAPTLEKKDFIGPVVGKDLKRRTLWAIILSLLSIIVYVAFRFSNPVWGVCGVIALFHDVIGTAAVFSLMGKEVDLLIVTALLTIAGYSINDTIIIFDRMREMLRVMRKEPLQQVIDVAINDTLSRTIITVMVVQIVCVVLLVWGGPVIHNFAFAMVIGNVLGTYSSIGVAAPLVYEWDKRSTGGRKAAPEPAPAPRVKAKPAKNA